MKNVLREPPAPPSRPRRGLPLPGLQVLRSADAHAAPSARKARPGALPPSLILSSSRRCLPRLCLLTKTLFLSHPPSRAWDPYSSTRTTPKVTADGSPPLPPAHRARAPCSLSCIDGVGVLICLPRQREGRRRPSGSARPARTSAAARTGPGLWLIPQASRWPLSPPQAELMSSLIEYCIELNQAMEPAAPPESASGPLSVPGSPPPPTQRPQLRRQGSVVCSRIQHLSTIDYVEEGERPLCGTHAHITHAAGSPGGYGGPSSPPAGRTRLVVSVSSSELCDQELEASGALVLRIPPLLTAASGDAFT